MRTNALDGLHGSHSVALSMAHNWDHFGNLFFFVRSLRAIELSDFAVNNNNIASTTEASRGPTPCRLSLESRDLFETRALRWRSPSRENLFRKRTAIPESLRRPHRVEPRSGKCPLIGGEPFRSRVRGLQRRRPKRRTDTAESLQEDWLQLIRCPARLLLCAVVLPLPLLLCEV